MWVARDEDNKLFAYEFEPERHYDKWYDWDNGSFYGIIELDKSLFPDLKWENEPIEVKLIPTDFGINNDELDELAFNSYNEPGYIGETPMHWYMEGFKSCYKKIKQILCG